MNAETTTDRMGATVDEHMAGKAAVAVSLMTLVPACTVVAGVAVVALWWIVATLFGSHATPKQLLHDPHVLGVVTLILVVLALGVAMAMWLKRKMIIERL